MKIRLLMLVERDPRGRFTGVIFQEGLVRPECAGLRTGPGSAPEPAGG